jgi:hypothetical protein
MIVDANSHDSGVSPAFNRMVRCPACGGDSVYATSNPARPFCSERCKNMDFGAWASESFRVAAAPNAEELDLGDNTLQ